jgi:hypothetical protein
MVLGFGVGVIVLDWKPWNSDAPAEENRFLGMSCFERTQRMREIEVGQSKELVARAAAELAKAEAKEPC